MEKKNYAARAAIYAMGLVILAAGITMNIKTGLGVSTIISVPFAISSIWDVNFSLVTFATYALFVVIEMIIKRQRQNCYRLAANTIQYCVQPAAEYVFKAA